MGNIDEIGETGDAAPTLTYGRETSVYYVIMAGADAPTRFHRQRNWAEREAKRLAKHTPGRELLVVKLKSSYVFGEAEARSLVPPKASKPRPKALDKLQPGTGIVVSERHFRTPGCAGIVTAINEDDYSVLVELNDGRSARFAAGSLTPVMTPAEAAEMADA